MPSIRRTLTTLVLAAAVPVGGVALAPVAAQAQPARAADLCGYPPGHCTAFVNKSVYAPGQFVRFHVARHAYAPNSKVVPVIVTKGFRHRYHARHAGPFGGLNGRIRIPKNAPKGRYTLRLTGHKHGHRVTVDGHFRVR